MFLIFLLFHTINANSVNQIPDSCFTQESLVDRLDCIADYLPISDSMEENPFAQCISSCRKTDTGTSSSSCALECLELGNPTESAEKCILECSKEQTPIHQSQCLNKCRISGRLNATQPSKSNCNLCTTFFNAAYMADIESDTSQSLKIFCPRRISALPICQGIAQTGVEKITSMIMRGTESLEICTAINLCSADT